MGTGIEKATATPPPKPLCSLPAKRPIRVEDRLAEATREGGECGGLGTSKLEGGVQERACIEGPLPDGLSACQPRVKKKGRWAGDPSAGEGTCVQFIFVASFLFFFVFCSAFFISRFCIRVFSVSRFFLCFPFYFRLFCSVPVVRARGIVGKKTDKRQRAQRSPDSTEYCVERSLHHPHTARLNAIIPPQ
eukprot:RCo025407